MIDYEKLDKLMELPISEEMLGAYIEGNLSDVERDAIENVLIDSECQELVREINDKEAIIEEFEEIPDLDTIELPSDEEYNVDEGIDNIIKHFANMKEFLSTGLGDATESCGSVGAHMSVGEDAIDVTSSRVLQSYRDTCAIKSQQLILERFGKHFTEEQLVQQAYENGWYRPGRGTSCDDMGEILRANGVSCDNYYNCNIAHVVNALADGKQIMMAVDSGELWKKSFVGQLWEQIEDKVPLIGGADHALLVTGIDASDPSNVQVIVTDPGSGDLNKPYPLSQFIDAAKDSKFFMTVTDEPAPNVFDAFESGTTHLPMIGGMNYYEFMDQFGDYMKDGDVVPDSLWNDFRLSAFGTGNMGQGNVPVNTIHKQTSDSVNSDSDENDRVADGYEDEQKNYGADDGDEYGEHEENEYCEHEENEYREQEEEDDRIDDEEENKRGDDEIVKDEIEEGEVEEGGLNDCEYEDIEV